MKAIASIILGMALLTTTALAVPAQGPDWTQFRLTGNERTAEDVLAAVHAFDPSLDLSQVRESDLAVPQGTPVVLDAAGQLTAAPGLLLAPTAYECAGAGPFAFGALNPPPAVSPPGCGAFGFHPGGISKLAQAGAGQFSGVVAFGFGGSGFGFAFIFCSAPGGAATLGVLPPLPAAPFGCRGFSFGAPISAWGSWLGYEFVANGAGVGAAL